MKEVLSETPKRNPKTTAKSESQKPHQNNNIMAFDHKFKEEQSKVGKKPLPIINKAKDSLKVCTVRETMSTATATITHQREKGDQTGKRVNRTQARLKKNRSFSDDYGGRRERTVHVHGSRNVGSVRLVQCRDQEGQKIGNMGMHRRRDSGENSFRRPMLAATCSDAGAARSIVGRSSSMRRTNRSQPVKGCRKVENPVAEGKRGFAKESLENPLVSLECFIFI